MLAFGDVARHEVRQGELLEAFAHLFNLRFLTDEATRTVYVEPEATLFRREREIDWRDRTDLSRGVERREILPEVHECRTLGYREGDGAVKRFEAATGEAFGRWSFTTAAPAAKMGSEVRLNPLFAPSCSAAGHYDNAPSAQLLEVGDRDSAEQGAAVSPRIVRYAGMHPLAAGERWGYPAGGAEYPLAAFHFAGDGATEPFTLCFEERDGAAGLHRFHEPQLRREAASERITLHLRVAPDEYEALFVPGNGRAELRSLFRIESGAGAVRATLAAAGPYDPEAGLLCCTFNRENDD